MKRQRIIRSLVVIGAALLLLVCSKQPVELQEREGTVADIYVATDLHYLSPLLTDHGYFFETMIHNSDGKVMEYTEELTDAFVYSVILEKPQILVLTGDLTFNGEKLSHQDLSAKLQKIEDAGIPVLVIPGNHDLNNKNAASFFGDYMERKESVTSEEFTDIYRNFGYEGALSYDDVSLSYVWEVSPQLRFLMLDVNGVQKEGKLPNSSVAWMKEQLELAENAGCQVLSFSHQNLLQHSMFTYGYVIDNSSDILQILKEYQVPVHFSGHLHPQRYAKEEGLLEIATSSMAVSPNQYAQISLTEQSLDYQTKSVDVAGWAKATGNNNPDLLDFAAYAKDFFWDTGYTKTMQELKDVANAEEMAAYFCDVNEDYFAGRTDMFPDNESCLSQWKNQNAMSGIYLESIVNEPPMNYNEISVSIQR